MSVTLNFAPETERKLKECAAQSGQSVEGFIEQLVEREVLETNGGQPSRATDAQPPSGTRLEEILAPVREEFEKSGMTDEDLAELVEDLREKIWQEKQSRKAS